MTFVTPAVISFVRSKIETDFTSFRFEALLYLKRKDLDIEPISQISHRSDGEVELYNGDQNVRLYFTFYI